MSNRFRGFTTELAERRTRVFACSSEASDGSKAVRGFTLIELLVVIAIIGILSAVVLAALGSARSKGNDAAIQSDLDTIRAQSSVYFDANSNGYGSNVAFTQGCATSNTLFSDPRISRAAAAADAANGTGAVYCNVAANGAAFAVFAQLVTNTSRYWCVDSAVKGVGVTSPPDLNATVCP